MINTIVAHHEHSSKHGEYWLMMMDYSGQTQFIRVKHSQWFAIIIIKSISVSNILQIRLVVVPSAWYRFIKSKSGSQSHCDPGGFWVYQWLIVIETGPLTGQQDQNNGQFRVINLPTGLHDSWWSMERATNKPEPRPELDNMLLNLTHLTIYVYRSKKIPLIKSVILMLQVLQPQTKIHQVQRPKPGANPWVEKTESQWMCDSTTNSQMGICSAGFADSTSYVTYELANVAIPW